MNNPDDQTSAAAVPLGPKRYWFTPNNLPDDPNRLAGMEDFVTGFKAATQQERDRCILDPCFAKQKFAEWGGFYVEGQDSSWNSRAIPASTVFRIYETEDPTSTAPSRHRTKRDEQVVIVLDNKEILTRTPTWRCTYSPYSTSSVAAQDSESS